MAGYSVPPAPLVPVWYYSRVTDQSAKKAQDTWLAGQESIAARIDPAIAAIVMAILEVVIGLDVHTALGIDTATLVQFVMGAGLVATVGRRVQVGRRQRHTQSEPASTD